MLVRSTLKKSGTTPSTGPPAADTVMPRETDSYGKWYGFQQGGNNVCGSSRHHQKQTALPPASTVQAAQLQHQGVSPLAPVHWLAQAAPRQPVCGESAAPTVGMSRVPSLQFALEIEDDAAPAKPRLSEAEILRQKSTAQIFNASSNCKLPHEKQVLNVVNGAKEVAASRNEQLTCDSLAAVFDSLGYSVYVRNALGGGPGMECMENLSHRFLVVEVPNAENTTESLIVDIDFRAQFELAQPTLLYQELMNNMDAEFIGSERFLRDAVQVLCDEMALAFKDQGQHPPPWRRMSSMLSKWCPRRSEDIAPSSRAVPEDMLKDMEKKGIVGVSTQKLRQSSLPSEGSSGASKRQAFRSPWKTSGRIAPAPHGLPWMQDGEADVIPSKA